MLGGGLVPSSFKARATEVEKWTKPSDNCSAESMVACRGLSSSTAVGARCAAAHDATKKSIARRVLDSTARPSFPKSTGASARPLNSLVRADGLYQILPTPGSAGSTLGLTEEPIPWVSEKALLSGVTFLIGGITAWVASATLDISFLVPLAAGNFIYIGASDPVPEVNKHRSAGTNVLLFASFVGGLAAVASAR